MLVRLCCRATILQEARSKAQAVLDAAKKLLADQGCTNVQASLLQGDARYCLANEAQRERPAMLVAASRGMGAVKRALLGSTTEYLIHTCEVPVVVVK